MSSPRPNPAFHLLHLHELDLRLLEHARKGYGCTQSRFVKTNCRTRSADFCASRLRALWVTPLRPGLTAALAFVREGDVLAVWKMDRLGRSLPHLIETVNAMETRGVGYRSVTEAIDTTTPGGRLIFHIFGALGQFERDLIQERTRAGLDAAAARGRRGGRKAGGDGGETPPGQDAHRQRPHSSRGRSTAQGGQNRAVCGARRKDCERL